MAHPSDVLIEKMASALQKYIDHDNNFLKSIGATEDIKEEMCGEDSPTGNALQVLKDYKIYKINNMGG